MDNLSSGATKRRYCVTLWRLLTTYSLIRDLTDLIAGSLRITARGEATGNKAVRLTIVDYSEHLNLLFLSLPPGKYPYFPLGADKSPDDKGPLLISGFRGAGDQFYSGDGIPRPYENDPDDDFLHTIWTEEADVLAGAPVYDSVAKLMGLVQEIDNGRVVYTPISYAMPLLTTVRVDDIFAAFNTRYTRLLQDRANELDAALRELRTAVTYDPVINVEAKKVIIKYDKMLADPALAELDVRVRAVYPHNEVTIGDDVGVRITEKTLDPEDNAGTSGAFDGTKALYDLMERTLKILPATQAFKFQIIGTLVDGTKVPSAEMVRKSPFKLKVPSNEGEARP